MILKYVTSWWAIIWDYSIGNQAALILVVTYVFVLTANAGDANDPNTRYFGHRNSTLSTIYKKQQIQVSLTAIRGKKIRLITLLSLHFKYGK